MSDGEEQVDESVEDLEYDKLYSYSIPLQTVDGIDKPSYSTSGISSKLGVKYSSTRCTILTNEVYPHFHKEDVNVSVDEYEVSSREDVKSVEEEVF